MSLAISFPGSTLTRADVANHFAQRRLSPYSVTLQQEENQFLTRLDQFKGSTAGEIFTSIHEQAAQSGAKSDKIAWCGWGALAATAAGAVVAHLTTPLVWVVPSALFVGVLALTGASYHQADKSTETTKFGNELQKLAVHIHNSSSTSAPPGHGNQPADHAAGGDAAQSRWNISPPPGLEASLRTTIHSTT